MKSTFTGGVFCVVGRGRWGSSLLAALKSKGLAASAVPGRLRGRDAGRTAVPLEASVYWLCVPDTEIAGTAQRLVETIKRERGTMRGQVMLHSSGVHDRGLLAEAASAGAQVGSVHPLMSFPTRKPVALDGVPFAVEAESSLRARLFRLVKALGGVPFPIRAEGKALYHAAAVMASPLLVSLAGAAEETGMLAGLSRRQVKALLQPIMERTLRNFFEAGAAKSFSGPFARGDAKTVSLHLAALRTHPELDAVYRSLALHALRRLPADNVDALRRILRPGHTGRRRR